MTYRFALGRDARVNALIGAGHFLSHFYQLCLPPLFIAWQQAFHVSLRRTRPGDGADVGDDGDAADSGRVPRRSLRRPPFLVGGTLLMSLSIAAMGLATGFWQILGAGDAVRGRQFGHPPGRLRDPERIGGQATELGRSFALHTFSRPFRVRRRPRRSTAAPDGAGRLARGASLGRAAGVPVVLSILWQSRILTDQVREAARRAAAPASGARLLLSRSMMMFFVFFMVSSMAGGGVQSWLITVLHPTRGIGLPIERPVGLDRLYARLDHRRAGRRLGRRPYRPTSCRS